MILLNTDLAGLGLVVVVGAVVGVVYLAIFRGHDRKRSRGMRALVVELSSSGPMTLDEIRMFMSDQGHGDANYTWMAVRDLMLSGELVWPEDPATGVFRLADREGGME